ncbi:glutathione S-transferase family protein [bacterium]|nr:glutathione S-transferase family protein [bacterium]
MITLYQFKLSHYCEKVRWALEYKGLPYKIINLPPGFHRFVIKKFAPSTSVPVIVDGKQCIQDSTAIINYLDSQYPQKKLTPEEDNYANKAIELEEYFDKELGIHLRRYFYHTMLCHRSEIINLLTADTKPFARFIFSIFFPFVRNYMRKGLNITPQKAEESRVRVLKALDKLDEMVMQNNFLVGNSFSRADLTAASLISPMVGPKKQPMVYPIKLPEPLENFRNQQKERPYYKWVHHVYDKYR